MDNPLVLEEERAFGEIRDFMYTDPDSARSLVHYRLSIIAPELKELYEMVYSNVLGSTYLFQSDYSQALSSYHRGLEIGLKLNSFTHISNAYNNIGAVNIYLGNYKDALTFLHKALEVNEEMNASKEIASSQNNIGRVYFEINDLDMAYKYFRQAYEGFCTKDNKIGISSVSSHLAQYFMRVNQPDSAFYYFKEAEQLDLQIDNNYGLTTSYIEFADFLLEKADYAKSLEYYNKGLSIAQSIEAQSYIFSALLGMGKLYYTMGLSDEALVKVNEALSIAHTDDNENNLYESSRLLAGIYELKGDTGLALTYLKEAETLKQKLDSHAGYAQIYNVEIQRLIDSNDAKEREIEQAKLVSNQRKALMLALIVFLSSFIIILSLTYYNYLYRIKQRQRIREQENLMRHAAEKSVAVINAEIEERKRISAELHDGIGPLLSLARMNLANLLEKDGIDNGKKRTVLYSTFKNIGEALKEIRDISNNVSPRILAEKGFVEALKELTRKLVQLRKFEVNLSINGINSPFKPHIEHALYRTVQEILNNSVRHSECSTIYIHALQDVEELTIMIEDNGNGFEVSLDKSKGMGLKNAAFRMEGLGGQFLVDSVPGRGTIVTLIIPVNVL